MAPSNGTTSIAPCTGTLVLRPICQSGSSPSPLLEVRTPIAIAIWGNMKYFIRRIKIIILFFIFEDIFYIFINKMIYNNLDYINYYIIKNNNLI